MQQEGNSENFTDCNEDYMFMHFLDCIGALLCIRAENKTKKLRGNVAVPETPLLSSKYRIFWQAVRGLAEREAKEGEKSSDSFPLDFVLDSFPDNAKRTDGRLWLPLHFAVMLPNIKLTDIQTILAGSPAAIKVPVRTNGLNPFQLAVMMEIPRMEIIQQLQIYYPDFASSLDADYGTLLHLAAAYSNLAMVQMLAKLYPAALEMRNNTGNTPLHMAAGWSTDMLVVRELAELYPAALEMKDTSSLKYIPLYKALFESESVEVFRVLLSLSPPLDTILDDCYGTPLEAIDSHTPAVDGKLQLLLEATSQEARTAFCSSFNYPNLPLHAFLYYREKSTLTPKTVAMLLAANRDAVNVPLDFHGGLLPIHSAAANASLEVMKMITEANVSNLSVIVDDDRGSVAHYAVYGTNLENLRYIHSLKPELFYSLDFENNTPLHVLIMHSSAALAEGQLSVASDILRFLLRHYPSMATAENSDGSIAYDYLRYHDDYVTRLLLMAGASSLHPGELEELNYDARREAMLLFFCTPTTTVTEPNIFYRIRHAAGDTALMRTVISIL